MFDPTLPPPGRLARLGVVLDSRQPTQDIGALARLCERAGIDAVWASAGVTDRADGDQADPWAVAAAAAPELARTRLGVFAAGGGAQLTGSVREVCATDGPTAERLLAGHPGVRRSVLVEDAAQLRAVISVVDDVALASWRVGDLEAVADEARAVATELGRDPATLGVAVVLPVSIGRTGAEASARAQMDTHFAEIGHAADIGIFGTLEECQDRVIALAHAGVTDLRCVVPITPDVHDVIAQLTAITIGTTDVLVPGSLRSPAPPPPAGWGGRSERPPRPGISGGSRRQ